MGIPTIAITQSILTMANQKTLAIAAFAALALVCGSAIASASASSSETEVLSRTRRFSIEGVVTCLAMIEFAGLPQLINEIETYCQPHVDQTLRYRLCIMSKVAHLGPEYVQCVLES